MDKYKLFVFSAYAITLGSMALYVILACWTGYKRQKKVVQYVQSYE